MQVVYSGGSTPNPSPRLQRKTGYGRPVMPGYTTHVHPQVLVQRSREKLTEGDMTLRDSIPAMSKCVASLCLLLNIVLPGSGTLTAGLSVLCCSHVRPKGDSKRHCIWVNAGVALVQFLLTFLFLLGWIWSIMWGVAFLSVSRQYYYRKNDEDNIRKHNGADNTHSKMNNMPKPNNEVTEGSARSMRKSHNSHQNSYYVTSQQSDHLEIKTSRASSSSQNSNADDKVPTISSDPGRDADNRNTPLSSNSYSESRDIHEEEPGLLPLQPIIVLQQAPLGSQVDTSGTVSSSIPEETILKAKTRYMKMMQRKMSDNDLSPFVLTNKQLEAIIIHDLPVRAPDSRHTEHGHSRDALPKC